jgi:hypothetical protein
MKRHLLSLRKGSLRNESFQYDYDPEWESAQEWADLSWRHLKDVFRDVVCFAPGSKTLLSKKQYASAKEKKSRKGYKSYLDFPDLVRGAILTTSLQESVEVVSFLLCHCEVTKWECKVGTATNPYKGSFHLDIRLGELDCEVQVMPKATWAVKSEAHKAYKQGEPEKASHLWDKVESFSEGQLQSLGL